jgi:hypothetical protein
MPVDVEVCFRAVQAFPHQVGQIAKRQDIGGAAIRAALDIGFDVRAICGEACC